MNEVIINGRFQDAGSPALQVSNKSYRYGDALFETIRFWKGEVQLADYHFARLFDGFKLLNYPIGSSTSDKIFKKQIEELCKRNRCSDSARVRLTVYRGNGPIHETNDEPGYTIECIPLDPTSTGYNSQGLKIGICPGIKKSCDSLSNLKTASALVYAFAAQHAAKTQWDDAVVLNENGNVADTSIANIFYH